MAGSKQSMNFVSADVIDNMKAGEHLSFLEDTGLIDFVSQVRWDDCDERHVSDMVEFIHQFDKSAKTSRVRGLEITVDSTSISKIFKLSSLGDRIDQDKDDKTPVEFNPSSCEDSVVAARVDFQMQALPLGWSRDEVFAWHAKRLEGIPYGKLDWSRLLTSRLHKLFKRGRDKHVWEFASHLHIILIDNFSAIVSIPSGMRLQEQLTGQEWVAKSNESVQISSTTGDGSGGLHGCGDRCTRLVTIVERQATELERLAAEVNVLKRKYQSLVDDRDLAQV